MRASLLSKLCVLFLAYEALTGGPRALVYGQTPAPQRPPNGYRFGFGAEAPKMTPVKPQVETGRLKTTIEMTLLTPRFGAGVDAQKWAKVLGDLGVIAQFRQPVLGDEPKIEDHVRGTLRTVEVVGALAPDGTLRFTELGFTVEDGKALAEWVAELQTYGAQGAPDGQPLWGLTKGQFDELYASLSQAVPEELEGLDVEQAIQKLPLPAAHPLKVRTTAEPRLKPGAARPVENRVAGFSCGTALAIVLAENGLAFRPLRTPDGGIELAVEPLNPAVLSWPQGWELENPTNQSDHLPRLFQFAEIGFENAALQDVLDACAAAVETPIVVDYESLTKQRVDLAKLQVSFPKKKTTWSLMLNQCIYKAGLTKQVRTDELGRPFLYISPFVPKSATSGR